MSSLVEAPAPVARPWRARSMAYLLAIAATSLALVLRLTYSGWFGDRPVLILFVLPIFLSAYVGGLGPGLLATAIAAVGTDYFLIPPIGELTIARSVDALQWLMLVGVGVLISTLTEAHLGRTPLPGSLPLRRGSAEGKVQAGFALALAVLTVAGVVSFTSATRLSEEADRTRHTEEVIAALNLLLATVTNAEAAQRGFILTGDDAFLDPFEKARQRTATDLQGLRVLLADNAMQQRRLDQLAPLLEARLTQASATIALRRSQGVEVAAAEIARGRGRGLQGQVCALLSEMTATERSLQQSRVQQARTAATVTRSAVTFGGGLAFALAAVALFAIRRDFTGMRHAEARLREANETLETRVGARTADLARSHDSLRRSEARLAGIVGSALDAIIGLDRAQHIVLFNAAAEALFRCPAAEALGQRFDRFVPGGVRFGPQLSEAADDDAGASLRSLAALRGRRTDGSTFPIEASSSEIEVDREHLTTVVLRDITERQRAAEDAGLLAAIVHSSLDAIIGKDPRGVVTSWNAGAERMFGYTAAEMIGQPIQRLIPPDRQEEEDGIQERLRRGEPVEQAETIRVRKDGSLVDVSVTISLLRDARGVILGASKVARDITAQKRAQQALRESEALFAAAFRSSPVAIAINRRRDQVNLEVNEAFLRMFDCTREQVLGRRVGEVGIISQPALDVLSLRLTAAGEVLDQELALETLSGRPVLVLLSVKVIQLQGEECSVSIVLDVTERKRAAGEIRAQLDELLRWQRVTLGREGRMLELKSEINQLLAAQGQPPRYADLTA